MLHTIVRKLKKIYQVGLRECIRIVVNRTMIKRFAQQHKQAALAKKVATTWDVFIKTHPNFILKKDIQFKDALIEHVDPETIIAYASNVLKNKILLFKQEIVFEGDNRWHTDFLLKQEGALDYSFDSEIYFNDIKIVVGKTHERVKDIRVVWELSRLHVLLPLGKAYALTKDNEYADCFKDLIIDWVAQNPYLLGVNWVCPMEVGIRAINLILGFCYFKDAKIDDLFLEHYICLLYDHMQYLEHTWEYYDGRTSNHYLSDLVGYFYLCVFFDKKTDWVVREILAECDKQIAPDGMSYEGSTSYHVLVTELCNLFRLLCEQESIALPHRFYQKLSAMQDAVAACTIHAHNRISIGDNDSGKVLWEGLPVVQSAQKKERFDFEQFGLTIVKKDGWHVSMRHHAYRKRQPSGHFHNDVGSITLALNGVPIVVDPGSYCYTASAYWRNYFRSASVHNSVSLQGKEPVAFDAFLFSLAMPEHRASFLAQKNLHILNTLYESDHYMFSRNIKVEKNILELSDTVRCLESVHEDLVVLFNSTFAPEVSLEKDGAAWIIVHKTMPICRFESDLPFDIQPGWVSYNYGSKLPTTRLCARVILSRSKTYTSCFRLLNSVL